MREECDQITENQIVYNLLSSDRVKYYLIIHLVHHYIWRKSILYYNVVDSPKQIDISHQCYILAVINKKKAIHPKYSTHKHWFVILVT